MNTTQESLRLRLLESENRELRRAVDELSALNELAQHIGAMHDSKEIIQTIVSRSLREVQAEQGVITLVDRKEQQEMKTLVREVVASVEIGSYHFDSSLLGWMHMNKRPLLINDPHGDTRFSGVSWDPTIRNLMSVPLMIRSELIGVLSVYNKRMNAAFTSDDQRLLAIIATQSAQVIENARLYEEEKSLIFLQSEMRFASDIQRDLLPKEPLMFGGYHATGRSLPARMVGGDYFDYFPIDSEHIGLMIGDVSGKGIPAALYMAVCRTLLRAIAARTVSPADCLTFLNEALIPQSEASMFTTIFYGILSVNTGRLLYACGGHTSPVLLHKDGTVSVLPNPSGMIVGALADAVFQENTVTLHADDMLVCYTDGVTEAMSLTDVPFGEDRLLEVLQEYASASPSELANAIIAAVEMYSGDRQRSDDITVLLVKQHHT
jgi:phosphoserine phosphatase RsbU/P